MNYQHIKSNIKSGDILVWTHKSWKTFYDLQLQLIRIFTQSEYTHIGVAWVVGDRVFVIEAASPEVRIYPLSANIPFYWIPCGGAYWDKTSQDTLLSAIGQKYSKWEAIKGFFNLLKVGDDHIWQCAELVNNTLISSRMLSKNRVKSTPSAIVEALLEMGFPIYLIIK